MKFDAKVLKKINFENTLFSWSSFKLSIKESFDERSRIWLSRSLVFSILPLTIWPHQPAQAQFACRQRKWTKLDVKRKRFPEWLCGGGKVNVCSFASVILIIFFFSVLIELPFFASLWHHNFLRFMWDRGCLPSGKIMGVVNF